MDFIRTRGATILGALLLTATPAFAATHFDSQWGLENRGQEVCRFDGKDCIKGKSGADIKARQAWKVNHDCSKVVVAVLDTGADQNHPDLRGNLLPGKNFVDAAVANGAQDDNLHGTHVAGIIAGAGSEASGVMGVCQKARVLPVKVGDKDGNLTDADILEGIQYAVAQKAKVLNASFGGGESNEVMKSAIAKANGTLFVVAAGNGDIFGRGFSLDQQAVFPASYNLPNMIVVAATDGQDRLAKFSNFGTQGVHLAAPGVNIVSTMPMQATDEMLLNNIPTEAGAIDGTSMATPFVTGAAALLWSTAPASDPLTIKQRILASVDKVAGLSGKVQTGGRLNLAKMLTANRVR